MYEDMPEDEYGHVHFYRTQDDPGISVKKSYLALTEPEHHTSLEALNEQWDRTFKESTFWREEARIAYEIENHQNALLVKYGYRSREEKEPKNERTTPANREELEYDDKEPDMDDR